MAQKVENLNLLPLIEQLLQQWGYVDAAEVAAFLHPDYAKHLHDPFLLTDMNKAVDRIITAVEEKQKIVIYGDYDIDGITASAVMIETISNLGHCAESYIPDRFEEGYGINQEALAKLKSEGVDLVISVDCGVTSFKEIEWANANGLDVIITDHHAVPPEIPQALAVINPKRPGDQYPFKELAGVGVAFKLAQALQQTTKMPDMGQEKWLLDLVALGTVCDVVPLVGENRVLAKYGLQVMHKTRRPGLKALAAVAGIDIAQVASYHLGFIIGPRLNAAGRLEHASRSLDLMLTKDEAKALQIAEQLNQLNRQRQTDQATIFAAANTMAEQYDDDPVLLLADPDWSHGIVGIVASKLVERWHKPTIVMQNLGETSKGSARSIGGFNMVEALRSASDILIKFGGHYFAAGMTIKSSDVDELRQRLNAYYRSNMQDTSESDLASKVDLNIENLGVLDWDLYAGLSQLEPFGNGNPQPIFNIGGLKVVRMSKVGKEQNHLRLSLADENGKTMEGIGFGLGATHPNIKEGQLVEACFQLSKNEFNDRTTLQLVIRDLK